MSRFVWAPLVFAASCGFYLFLAGSTDVVELLAMAVCATLGTALAVGLSIVAKAPIALRPPPRAIFRPFAALLPELLVVGRRLSTVALRGAGRHEGGFVHQPYAFGDASAREAGRRAVTLIGISLAPRSFVVRGEEADGTVLLHGFPPKPPSPDTRWPA